MHREHWACPGVTFFFLLMIASLMNGQFKPSTWHVGVKYVWLRELVRDGDVDISYVRTGAMIADGLTKGLERAKHQNFLNMLSLSM